MLPAAYAAGNSIRKTKFKDRTMTDIEKITFAKSYIDKMAQGINPLDGNPVPENDLINNVRISRCLYLVSQILDEACSQPEINTVKPNATAPFRVTAEMTENFPFNESGMLLKDIIDYFNSCADNAGIKRLAKPALSEWLISNGYLQPVEKDNGKHYKLPTEKGNAAGITAEDRYGMYGVYTVVLYDRQAQKLIVDSLQSIADNYYTNKKKFTPREGFENQGAGWGKEQDKKLTELYKASLSAEEISKALGRTLGGIRARLKKLGLSDAT